MWFRAIVATTPYNPTTLEANKQSQNVRPTGSGPEAAQHLRFSRGDVRPKPRPGAPGGAGLKTKSKAALHVTTYHPSGLQLKFEF